MTYFTFYVLCTGCWLHVLLYYRATFTGSWALLVVKTFHHNVQIFHKIAFLPVYLFTCQSPEWYSRCILVTKTEFEIRLVATFPDISGFSISLFSFSFAIYRLCKLFPNVDISLIQGIRLILIKIVFDFIFTINWLVNSYDIPCIYCVFIYCVYKFRLHSIEP